MSAVVAALDTPRTVRVEHVNHHYGEGVSAIRSSSTIVWSLKRDSW